jgi:hypothetical protein
MGGTSYIKVLQNNNYLAKTDGFYFQAQHSTVFCKNKKRKGIYEIRPYSCIESELLWCIL